MTLFGLNSFLLQNVVNQRVWIDKPSAEVEIFTFLLTVTIFVVWKSIMNIRNAIPHRDQQAIKLICSLRTDPEPMNPQPAAEQEEAAAEATHAAWPTTPSYAAIKAHFQAAGRLQTITGSSAWTASQWPNVPGVYLVWHRVDPNPRQLLYIGKTGKFVRDEDATVHFNGGTLRSRLQRWTPYCFQRQGPYAQNFEYGPNFGVNVLPNQPFEDRYRHRVPAAEIEVECLLLEGWGNHLSPALLECLLLQDHLLNHGDLPPANNEL